jgi:uncharacterized phage protein gp47/JayE
MPFPRPTLSTIVQRNENEVQTSVEGADLSFKESMLKIFCRLLAGASHEMHGRLSWMFDQIMPDVAEASYLERWSTIWGITRNLGEEAQGNVTCTGVASTSIPAGSRLVRSDGWLFSVDTATQLDGAGQASVPVTSTEIGENGNTAAGATLTFQTPIPNVDPNATVESGGLTGGSENESDASLLLRLLERISQPPHGGAEFDYPRWAKEVAGVTRAWAYSLQDGQGNTAFGSVALSFAMDDKTTYPDLIKGGNFTTDIVEWIKETGWAITGGKAVKTAGTASDLYQQIDPTGLTNGRGYKVSYTISDATAGTLVVKVGGTTVATYSTWPGDNGTYTDLSVTAGTADDIRFEADSTFDGKIDDVALKDEASKIIPGQSEIETVEEYLLDEKPICANLHMIRLDARAITATINLKEIADGYTAIDVKTNIQNELTDLLKHEGDPGGTLLISHVREAISSALGEIDHTLNLWDGASPADLSIGYDEVLVLGTITWA